MERSRGFKAGGVVRRRFTQGVLRAIAEFEREGQRALRYFVIAITRSPEPGSTAPSAA